ncbi:hypothetical protein [Pelagibacterium sp.]|uniref:hypothetical protein n=1 Tax=Pelagibacterium sp. TaxID=1967288 RepID=UPI003A92C3E0
MTKRPWDMARITAALAQPHSAMTLFAHVREGLRNEVGCGLMTASLYDLETMRTRRVYSDNVAAYAVGNFKRLDRNRFYETVVGTGRPFATTSIEQIAEVFFDWEHIKTLGFGSNMNLPALANGKVIGTVNLLEKTGHYTEDRVARAMTWQPLVTLCFLLLLAGDPETENFLGRQPSSLAITEGVDEVVARNI